MTLPESFIDSGPVDRNFRALDAKTTTLTDQVRRGAGSPETVVAAPVGTLYLRTDGGAGTTLYVKESGSAATGWIAK